MTGIGLRIAQEEILGGGDPQAGSKLLYQTPQGRPQPEVALVLHPAILDAQSIKELAISLCLTAQMQVASLDQDRFRRSQRLFRIPFQHAAEFASSPLGDQILEPCPLPVRAVAVIAVEFHHRFRQGEQSMGGYPANGLRQVREGVVPSMRHPHAAADQHVVADDLLSFHLRHETQILAIDVDTVVFRQRQPRLELPWEVRLAVDRFDRVAVVGPQGWRMARQFAILDWFTIEPDFMVRCRTRSQVVGQSLRCRLELSAKAVLPQRSGTTHDVTGHVPARRQGGEQGAVNARDGSLQSLFDDAVELNPLTGRKAERAVGQSPGQIVQRQVLLCGHLATRDATADHEHVEFAHPGLLPTLPRIPVLLLVGAMKLDQLDALRGEVWLITGQFRRQRPPQIVALLLVTLVGRELRRCASKFKHGLSPRRLRPFKHY